ncbi:MAG: SIMPL domain-containing protein [Methylovirgula sp.]|uniref:SIMPL domain-containing protein n=1 Tax=Methylovirgula sp. TaxID=1978224 RepID=UPI0030760507
MVFVRLVALICGCFASGAALAQVALTDSVPTITVVGHARTEVVPDFVTLSLAVVSEKPTASAAAAANAQAAQAVVQELEDQGIDPKDVQTSEVSLMPVYDNVSDAVGHTSSQKLRGYQARNGVKIRVSDISKAGALAGRLIDRGANEFQGLSFGATHEPEIRDKLNDEAMRDAVRKAKAFLPAAGVGLGQVLQIAPDDRGGLQPGVFAKAMAPSVDYSPTIEPGTLIYEAQVRVTWALTQH